MRGVLLRERLELIDRCLRQERDEERLRDDERDREKLREPMRCCGLSLLPLSDIRAREAVPRADVRDLEWLCDGERLVPLAHDVLGGVRDLDRLRERDRLLRYLSRAYLERGSERERVRLLEDERLSRLASRGRVCGERDLDQLSERNRSLRRPLCLYLLLGERDLERELE